MSRRLRIVKAAALVGAATLLGSAIAPAVASPEREAAPRVLLAPIPAAFQFPVAMALHPESDDLYVVEKGGTIRAVRDGLADSTPVLDVSDEVSGGNEQGLLGLAFAPDGEHLYVNLTDTAGDTRILEFAFEDGFAIEGSRREVLTVDQPFANHNGGTLHFGPDGYLYIGFGDGGSGGDPQYNGQSLDTLLGKMVRIDPAGGAPYAIPEDNPFVGGPAGARPELWAYGLRNPWKFSFDRETGDLWIADVGQNSWEEINFQAGDSSGGENYGWNHMEGLVLHTGRPAGAEEPENHVPPVHVYSISGQSVSCAVVGGFVYRGEAIPWLRGAFVFSDWCDGSLRYIRGRGGEVVEATELDVTVPSITAFGQDHDGELYAISQGGTVFRILPVPGDPAMPEQPGPGEGSRVEALEAEAGDAVQVSGSASFAADPVLVGSLPPRSGATAAPGVGMDLAWGAVTQESRDLLAFDLGVYDMPPAAEGLPEVVHYTWDLTAHRDGEEVDAFALQAIRSAQGVEPGSAEPVFRLLRCEDDTCESEPLTGAFHEDGVRVSVPASAISAAEGAVLRQAGDGVVASFGASGLAWDVGGDRMPIVDVTVHAPIVELGIAPAGTPVEDVPLTATVSVGEGGAFAGELPLPSDPGAYTVVARACLGPTSCDLASTTVTIG